MNTEDNMKALVGFLTARYDEDEAAINARRSDDPFVPYGQHWSEVPFPTASAQRGLADTASKRRVLKHLVQLADLEWTGSYAVREEARNGLMALAAPYADHPDFNRAWADSGSGGHGA